MESSLIGGRSRVTGNLLHVLPVAAQGWRSVVRPWLGPLGSFELAVARTVPQLISRTPVVLGWQ